MLDRLIDLLLQFLELFRFWVVLDPYEAGVLLRLGKFVKVLEPGFHWIIPFGIDRFLHEHTVPTTHSLGDESITSSDGVETSFHAIITSKVNDIQKSLLDVEDVEHAIRDACSGEIGRIFRESTWSEICAGEDFLLKLSTACRKRGWRWGIEIMSVQLAGLCRVKNLRLLNK